MASDKGCNSSSLKLLYFNVFFLTLGNHLIYAKIFTDSCMRMRGQQFSYLQVIGYTVSHTSMLVHCKQTLLTVTSVVGSAVQTRNRDCLPVKAKFECVEMLWLQQLNVLNGLLLLLRHTEMAMSVLGKSILTFIFITKGKKEKKKL